MFHASLDNSGPPTCVSHRCCWFHIFLRLAAHSGIDGFSLRHTCLLSVIKNSYFLRQEIRSCSDFSLQLTLFHESCFTAAQIASQKWMPL